MTVGIYKISNKSNDKVYIGQSRDVERRFREHKRGLNRGDYYNDHLQSSWDDYGSNAFSFEIVKECEPEYLDELEKFYIAFYNSMNRDHGYNLESGGNAKKTDSPETRAKKSKAMMGENNPMYGKYGDKNPMYGKEPWNKGMPLSEEDKMGKSRARTSTGLFGVTKDLHKDLKQGFRWKYQYTDENKKHKSISSTDLAKLMLKVTLKDLPWRILDIDKALDTINENK